MATLSTTPALPSKQIDHQVKGTTPQGFTPITPPTLKPPLAPSNPLDAAPSSPSQIYLNLLILEADLRRQYVYHLARRRKFTFFLVLLCIWIGFFGYRFFILGGSPYYYVSHLEKVGLGGGIVTGVLYYATGLYHKTIVEPRRFVASANRGLRSINIKLVKVPLNTREWISWWCRWYTFRPPPPRPAAPIKRRPSHNAKRPIHLTAAPTKPLYTRDPPPPNVQSEDEDDVDEWLPGGMHIKLVVLPRGFSPDFREGWELYRVEYWEKENEERQHRMELYRSGKLEVPHTADRIRSSRTSSMSSYQGRSTTPEADHVSGSGSGVRRRKGSMSTKRRPVVGGSGPVSSGDVSDSGSTTSVGEKERLRRSESIRSDRSSSSTSSAMERTRSTGSRGSGKIRMSRTTREGSV